MESAKIATAEMELEQKLNEQQQQQQQEGVQQKTSDIVNSRVGNLPRYVALAKYFRNLVKLSGEVGVKKPHQLRARFDKLCNIKVENLDVSLEITRELIGKVIPNNKEDRAKIVDELVEALLKVSKMIIEEEPSSSLCVVIAEIKNLFCAWKKIKAAGKVSEESILKIDELFAQTLRVCSIANLYITQYTQVKEKEEQGYILSNINKLTKEIKELYDKCKKAIGKIDYIELTRNVRIIQIHEDQSKVLNMKRAEATFTIGSITDLINDNDPLPLLVPATFKLLEYGNSKVAKKAVKVEERLMLLKEAIQEKEAELEAYLKEIELTREKAVQFLKDNKKKRERLLGLL